MIETQSMEGNRARKRLTGRQIKLLVGGLIVVLTVGYLIFAAARGSVAYYLTIAELAERGHR